MDIEEEVRGLSNEEVESRLSSLYDDDVLVLECVKRLKSKEAEAVAALQTGKEVADKLTAENQNLVQAVCGLIDAYRDGLKNGNVDTEMKSSIESAVRFLPEAVRADYAEAVVDAQQ